MQTDAYRLWLTRIVTFTLFALVSASAAFWGLKGWRPSTPPVNQAVMLTQSSPVGPQAVARALGGGLASVSLMSGTQAPPAVGRYVLVGVVAAGHPRGGAALISVDGQEAKPVRVGGRIDGGLVLQSVASRSAVLSPDGGTSADITLELPPLND